MRHKTFSQPNGLEVDAYNDGLHFAYNRDNLPEVLNAEFFEKRNGQRFPNLPRRDEPSKSLLQGTTFRLSVALIVSLALAIVAAALAATMATTLHQVKRQLATCRYSTAYEGSNEAAHIPTSDCVNLTSPYDSILKSRYKLHCNTNQPNTDLASIFVYTFQDCIHACDSYDHMGTHPGSTCLGVAYSYTTKAGTTVDNYDDGNCALKSVGYNGTAAFSAFGVDSAFLLA